MNELSQPPVAETDVAVRWADQDRYWHVNNVRHFQYFEEARGQWLRSLGFPMNGQGTGPVLIKAEATYLKEINYPANMKVQTWVCQPGNTSLQLFHRIVDAKTATLYAEGVIKLVWVNHDTGKSIPLPDALRVLATENGIILNPDR